MKNHFLGGGVRIVGFHVKNVERWKSESAKQFAKTNGRLILRWRMKQFITDTLIPGSSAQTPPAVPEPATLALVGIGLPFAGLLRCVRRRRRS